MQTLQRVVLTAGVVDLEARQLVPETGEPVTLFPREVEVLSYLAARPGELVSREELERRVWGFRSGVRSKTVPVCIRRLRSKIEVDPRKPEHIRTVRGQGWIFQPRRPDVPRAAGHSGLPRARDAFVGRADEVAALRRLLKGADRLITVVGPGGVGKSRLARHVLGEQVRAGRSAGWTVPLGEAGDARQVAVAVARALGIPLHGGDPIATVGHALAARPGAVVILDEVEQVVEGVRRAVQQWLDAASDVRLLCTSRQALGLPGERLLHLAPMSPADAVALFRERSPVPVGPREHAEVSAIVAAADHLPLAVEIAASRAGLVPLSQLAQRVDLANLGPGELGLQASLSASWRLLSVPARSALSQLATFQAPFSVEDAEAVLSLPDGVGPLAVLQELADASMLQVRRSAGTFSMLGLVRQFADSEAGEGEERGRRHARWAAGRAEVLLDEGEVEVGLLPDLEVACRWATEHERLEWAVPTALAAAEVYLEHGPGAQGLACVAPLAARVEGGSAEAVRVQIALGRLCRGATRLDEARAALRAAVVGAAHLDDADLHAEALVELGQLLLEFDAPSEAQRVLEQAMEVSQPLAPHLLSGRALHLLANARQLNQRHDEAVALHRRAEAIYRTVESPRWLSILARDRAVQSTYRGQLARSRALLDEAWAWLGQEEAPRARIVLLGRRGDLCRREGDFERAERQVRDALVLCRQVGIPSREVPLLHELGKILWAQGRRDAALAAMERARALAADTGQHVRIVLAELMRVLWLLDLSRLDAAERRLDGLQEEARRLGRFDLEATVRLEWGRLALYRGQLAVATSRIEEAAADLADTPAARLHVSMVLAELAVAHDDLPTARRHLDRARQLVAQVPGEQVALDGLARRIARLDATAAGVLFETNIEARS